MLLLYSSAWLAAVTRTCGRNFSTYSKPQAIESLYQVREGNLGGPVVVEKNHFFRVHRILQIQNCEEGLVVILKDARDGELPIPENLDPSEWRTPRGTAFVLS